jgi:hypothetical protein
VTNRTAAHRAPAMDERPLSFYDALYHPALADEEEDED